MQKKIILFGYMGSGKSTIAAKLASNLKIEHIDLDQFIEEKEQISIAELFKSKGEIYFRKKEAVYLNDILQLPSGYILSIGGGTPCYGNNLDNIKATPNSITVYLKTTIPQLTERLFNQRSNRPLISHLNSRQELQEFIGKHLFERTFYYNQADVTISTDNKTVEEVSIEIIKLL